jgi:hypothetical protein
MHHCSPDEIVSRESAIHVFTHGGLVLRTNRLYCHCSVRRDASYIGSLAYRCPGLVSWPQIINNSEATNPGTGGVVDTAMEQNRTGVRQRGSER